MGSSSSNVFNLLCGSRPPNTFRLGLTLVICEGRPCWPHRFDLGERKVSEPLLPLPTLVRPRVGWSRYAQCSKQIPGSPGSVRYRGVHQRLQI